jgi:hypothetical protein
MPRRYKARDDLQLFWFKITITTITTTITTITKLNISHHHLRDLTPFPH